MTDRYVTLNCQLGACSACPYGTLCAHECHVDHAARVEVVPDPMVHCENPAFVALVEERGTRLCMAAEPHTHSPSAAAPCDVHRSEARRQLFDRWLGQQGAVA